MTAAKAARTAAREADKQQEEFIPRGLNNGTVGSRIGPEEGFGLSPEKLLALE